MILKCNELLHKVGEKVFVCVKYDECTHSYLAVVKSIIGSTSEDVPYPYKVSPLHRVEGETCSCCLLPGRDYLIATDEIFSNQEWEI